MSSLTTTRRDMLPARRPACGYRARQSGMTLIELIVVMVLVGILAAIGIPSFETITTSSRMAAESNDLLGDMQFARAEAAREGEPVTVCISANGTSCDSASTTWQEGWIVFSDLNDNQTVDTTAGDTVLRIQKALSGTDTFTSSNTDYAVTFSREGFAQLATGGSLTIKLHDAAADKYYTRCLIITQAGMMSIQTPSTDATGCT
jgi:type IV fimbrial biogenesis protein FimT